MANMIGLQITLPDGSSRDAVYDIDSILIGSGPSAVLRLEDASVSSIHAVIKVAPEGTATVIDLGSETGTRVNGGPVTEPTSLKQGDLITVGGVRLKVTSLLLKGAASSKPAAAASVPSFAPPPLAKPAPVSAPKAVSAVTQPTQRIARKGLYHEPTPGARVVTEGADIDPAILSTPLPEANKPTSEARVLQVSVYWGNECIDAVQVSEPRPITVGGRLAKKPDLSVEGNLPADAFTVAVNMGGEAQVIVPANAKVGLRKADGSVTRGVELTATDAPFPAKAYRLSLHERIAFKVDTLTFVAQFVRGDVQLGKGAVMDWYFPRVFTISALCHLFFVVAAFITPRTSSSLVDDLLKNQNRFAQMILKAPEPEKKNKKLDLSGMKGGAKHKDEEGKFGKKDLPKKDAVASKAGAPRVDPNKREKDRQIALNSGLLGILKGASGAGAVSNVFGPGGLGTGINNAMGGLRGSEMGDAGGAGGLGTRGTGAGGGGDSLGIGGLGTHGHGRGTGGYGNIDLGGRGKGTTRIVPGKTIIKGSLSKEEIGRVIRRNLARFKYCYEKELNKNPNLSGKISVYFTIAPTGSVAEASIRETSMNEQNVEECALKVMRSLKFPQPRGGGIVVVTYPFVFAST